MPRFLIALLKDIAERRSLFKEAKLLVKVSLIHAETSTNEADVWRLWKTLNIVADGDLFNGEIGMSHWRKFVAACSMLPNGTEFSLELLSAPSIELAIPWRLV